MDAAIRQVLIAKLSETVAPPLFRAAVVDAGLLLDFDLVEKQSAGDQTALVGTVVTTLDANSRLFGLLKAIRASCFGDPKCKDALGQLFALLDGVDAHEAALSLRAHSMRMPGLRKLLEKLEGQLCLIAATHDDLQGLKTGTGFLVGPDLVLTAYHTLQEHIEDRDMKRLKHPRLLAVFDHLDPPAITDLRDVTTLQVPFADDWLVAHAENLEDDGKFRTPTADQLKLLPDRLDFALVRLAQPVGLYSIRVHEGGARRGWIDLTQPVSDEIDPHDRILIPQHFGGHPQRIDVGDHKAELTEHDTSITRFRYSTETRTGASGAPCFNNALQACGMHHAAFMPTGAAEANQGIRLARIQTKLNGHLGNVALPIGAASKLWSTTGNVATPKVVLGRTELRGWLVRAMATEAAPLPTRVFGVLGERSRSGRSFTHDVVRAAVRAGSEPVAVLGDQVLTPASAEDFLAALFTQWGIPVTELNNLPARPAMVPTAPAGAPGDPEPRPEVDADKINKWFSDDVPAWFSRVLDTHRIVTEDEGAWARQTKQEFLARNKPVPPDIEALASQPPRPPTTRTRWPRVWICLDNVDRPEGRLSSEVEQVIGGLLAMRLAADATAPALRTLRWVFIGTVPDFVLSLAPEVERLDATAIQCPAMVEVLMDLNLALGKGPADANEEFIRVTAEEWWADNALVVNDPLRRLPAVQQRVDRLATGLYRLIVEAKQ